MNPEKRFGQIEELLADVIIKVDRLTDGQGKILEHVAKQGADIENLKTEVEDIKTTFGIKIDTTARAIGTLTVENQRNFNEIKEELGQVKQTQQQILDFLREKLS